MEEHSFMDILSDKTFCDFVHNRNVIDSFHYIRKNGNQAVHSGDSQPTSEDAIAVLQDLHFVSGEIACLLGLIKEYPDFEANCPASIRCLCEPCSQLPESVLG